jgi:hypothetical protein
MPMKTHTVTSIMFLTWSMVPPRPASAPQKSVVNAPALKPTAAMAMNVRMGTTLATVTTTFTNAAFWTPLRVSACTSHRSTEAPRMAGLWSRHRSSGNQ